MQCLRENPWIVFVLICLGFFMTILDATIVNIAIPEIIEDLEANISQALWVMSSYVLMVSVLVITAGRAADIFGPRNVFFVGMVVFTGASVFCGLAQSPEQLITARAFQGVGAALITPQTLTIMSSLFPPEKRGLPSALWGMTAGLAGVAGPTLGGLLIESGSWRWIFLVNVPIGVAIIALTFLLVPDLRPGERHRLDLVGVVLVSLALGGITYGLLEGERYGWGDINQVLSIPMIIGLGIVLLAAFLFTQTRIRQPLLPLEVFRDRNFSLMCFVIVAASFGLMGLALTMTMYLQQAVGLNALEAGLTLVPVPIAMMLTFPLVGLLINKIGGKVVLACGLALLTVGLVLIGELVRAGVDTRLLLAPLALAGVAQAACMAPTISLALQNIREELSGAASGAFNAIRQLGMLVAIVSVGAVLQSRLVTGVRAEVWEEADDILSPAVRDEVVDSSVEAARGAESGIARLGLPEGMDGDVVERMQQVVEMAFQVAFADAVRVSLFVCGGFTLVACLLSLISKPAVTEESVEGERSLQ